MFTFRNTVWIVGLIGVSVANQHATADWSHVRGPTFDGHSEPQNLADSWPASGPPVLWTRQLGQGYSGFVAQENRVYTQAQSVQGQFVYCLNAITGETIWTYRYDWPYELAGVYPGPRSTPTLAGDRLFFAGPSGLIGCLNAETGQLVWSRNVVNDYHGDGGIGFGYSCTPTVIDGMVILPVGGVGASLVALDMRTGDEVWSEGDDPASYGSAFPIERNGRKLVVGYLENALVIHDRLTGELLFRKKLSAGYDEHSAWPIYREPYLWLSAPFQAGSQLLELPAEFNTDAQCKIVWASDILSNDVVSSVLVDECVFGFDLFEPQAKTQRPSRGKFRCIEFRTGAPRWEQGSGRPQRANNDTSHELGQAGIVVVGDKMILLNERGELILLATNTDDCEILARTSVLAGELTWTPPALHNGCVFIRNQTRAVCLYLGQPEALPATVPRLAVTDIPQSAYIDWAGRLLPVEPEYAFDLPTSSMLWNWFWACEAILLSSLLLASVISALANRSRRLLTWRTTYLVIGFIGGAAGTTVLSLMTGTFIFTWPLCLFVAFEPLLTTRDTTDPQLTRASIRCLIRERIKIVPFLIVAYAYYALCHRLSLVTEWVFLVGFAAAVPLGLIERKIGGTSRASFILRMVLKLASFALFYLAGVAGLIFRYQM